MKSQDQPKVCFLKKVLESKLRGNFTLLWYVKYQNCQIVGYLYMHIYLGLGYGVVFVFHRLCVLRDHDVRLRPHFHHPPLCHSPGTLHHYDKPCLGRVYQGPDTVLRVRHDWLELGPWACLGSASFCRYDLLLLFGKYFLLSTKLIRS